MLSKSKIGRFFRAIRRGDLPVAREMLEADPALLEARQPSPPKRDAGCTPLLAMLEIREREIASLLLDRGADVHATRLGGEPHAPHYPVVAAAVVGVVGSLAWRRLEPGKFAHSLWLLQRVLDLGADPNLCDKRGRPPLCVALDHLAHSAYDSEPTLLEFDVPAVQCLFDALLGAGADPDLEFDRDGGRTCFRSMLTACGHQDAASKLRLF